MIAALTKEAMLLQFLRAEANLSYPPPYRLISFLAKDYDIHAPEGIPQNQAREGFPKTTSHPEGR